MPIKKTRKKRATRPRKPYTVDDLLTDLDKSAAAEEAPPEPCGKPSTCYKCTVCTSTGMSRCHAPDTLYNNCAAYASDKERKQLREQLRYILASEHEGEIYSESGK